MATLKLPPGKVYVPGKNKKEISVPVRPTNPFPKRRGHAAATIRFDQFRKRGKPDDIQIRRRNTPQGAVKYARDVKREIESQSHQEAAKQAVQSQRISPEILLQHAVTLVRLDMGLRRDRLAHPPGYNDESRLPRRKPQRPRITQMEKGDTPARKKTLRLLRKVGII